MSFNVLAFDLRDIFENSNRPVQAAEIAALLLSRLDESTRKEYGVALVPTREQINLVQKFWQ